MKKCEALIENSWGDKDQPCLAFAQVHANGKWYCKQHAPRDTHIPRKPKPAKAVRKQPFGVADALKIHADIAFGRTPTPHPDSAKVEEVRKFCDRWIEQYRGSTNPRLRERRCAYINVVRVLNAAPTPAKGAKR